MPRHPIEWIELVLATVVLSAFVFVGWLEFGLLGFILALMISGSALGAMKRLGLRRRVARRARQT